RTRRITGRRTQNRFGSDGASLWTSGFPSGHTHSPTDAPMEIKQWKISDSNRERRKTAISKRTLEQITFADYLLRKRIFARPQLDTGKRFHHTKDYGISCLTKFFQFFILIFHKFVGSIYNNPEMLNTIITGSGHFLPKKIVKNQDF